MQKLMDKEAYKRATRPACVLAPIYDLVDGLPAAQRDKLCLPAAQEDTSFRHVAELATMVTLHYGSPGSPPGAAEISATQPPPQLMDVLKARWGQWFGPRDFWGHAAMRGALSLRD
jgi:hypothetical protein